MIKKSTNNPAWVQGSLRLAGLDTRMIALLAAIAESGSINQAAKQVGLSYKGAWQMIERANNGSPKVLVSTATGGSHGGGTRLTAAGKSLLALFLKLEQQHNQFLAGLNQQLVTDPDTVLLLQHLVVKTSARNQLFGTITAIHTGAVKGEVVLSLSGGERVIVTLSLSSFRELGLMMGADAVVLINGNDIMLALDLEQQTVSSRNRLQGIVLRIQQDTVNAEVIVMLAGGDTFAAMITLESLLSLALTVGMPVWVLFKSNAPMLGIIPVGGAFLKQSRPE